MHKCKNMQPESEKIHVDFHINLEEVKGLLLEESLGEVMFLKQKDAGCVCLWSRIVLRQAEKHQENK